MKYDVDYVVTLNDGKEYYLIDKNILNGETYFYAVEYTGDVDSMFDNEKCFFKSDKGKLIDVNDIDLIIELKTLFLNKFEEII